MLSTEFGREMLAMWAGLQIRTLGVDWSPRHRLLGFLPVDLLVWPAFLAQTQWITSIQLEANMKCCVAPPQALKASSSYSTRTIAETTLQNQKSWNFKNQISRVETANGEGFSLQLMGWETGRVQHPGWDSINRQRNTCWTILSPPSRQSCSLSYFQLIISNNFSCNCKMTLAGQ